MGENISGIQAVGYSHEGASSSDGVWNTEKTVTASAGSATTVVADGAGAEYGLLEATLNWFAGALFKCVGEDTGTDILNSLRRCDGSDVAASGNLTDDTATFNGDPWDATTADGDTFKFWFTPRFSECSLSREPKFGDRSGYMRESLFKKYKNPHIRTESGVTLTAELGGMGHKAGYDVVAASPAPTTTTFSVADGTRFTAGQSILVDNTTDGLTRVTISSISTNALTTTPAMSTAPTAADGVFGMSEPGELGVLMAGCMGSVLQSGRGDVAAAPSSSTTFTVTDGTQFDVGGIVGVDVNGGGTVEWAQITTISTNLLTVTPAFSATPTSGTVYNTWTIQPADTGHESFTFTLYKHAIKYILNGCRGTFGIDNIALDELANVNFDFMGGGKEARSDEAIPADWDDNYAAFDPPIPVGAYLQIAPATTTAASEEFVDASFELGSGVSRRYSPSATAGIANVSVTGWDAPTISCKINKDTLASFNPLTAQEAGTLQHVRLVLGGTPGKTVVIDFRQAQTMVVNDSEDNDRDTWDLEFIACDDATVTARPPIVIALG